jgi:hypothetical protein
MGRSACYELELVLMPLPSHIWGVTPFLLRRHALDYVVSVRDGMSRLRPLNTLTGCLNILRAEKNNEAFSGSRNAESGTRLSMWNPCENEMRPNAAV